MTELGLTDKVAVIAGVGPNLGARLARRFAAAGATVVLAARSADRLTALAARIADTGGRAEVIATDITSDDSVAALAATAVTRCGGVDVLINNAFSYPAMTTLAKTDPQHIRDAVELMTIGALRTTLALTEALAGAQGAVVNINSMVIRHSQGGYGSYKIAKSAQLAMAQSLATELGPRGIRVNSVVPGWIWGDTLRGYFEYRAQHKGGTAEQYYADAAKASDLKRLPTEDEVANAALFLASPLASGITGQTLDVNCGEYHA